MTFSLYDARKWNASLKEKLPKMVAVFVGGTSGIGEHAAKQLALALESPTIYIIGRNDAAGHRVVEELKTRNPNGSYIFKSCDVCDLHAVDWVCSDIAGDQAAIDLLFLTPGALALRKQETPSGIDRNHILRYYSRMRFVYNLMPSLEKSEDARVVSVLAAGKEDLIKEDNLDLKRHFSLAASTSYPATMTSVLFEVLASKHPSISFVHEFPGFVATPLLKHSWGSIAGAMFGLLMKPLAMSASESGEWSVFLSTSPSFPPRRWNKKSGPGMEEVQIARSSTGQVGDGVYLLNYDGKDVTNHGIMGQLRALGIPSVVEKHTLETMRLLSS